MIDLNRERALRELWKLIPDPACIGACVASCGPIGATPLEHAMMERHGNAPLPDMNTMVRHYLATPGDAYHCPNLVDGRCSVYNDRPTICRMFGAEETMLCPHGCRPRQVLNHAEGSVILQASLDIGGYEL